MPLEIQEQKSVAVHQLTNPSADLALVPSTAEAFFSALEKTSKSTTYVAQVPL